MNEGNLNLGFNAAKISIIIRKKVKEFIFEQKKDYKIGLLFNKYAEKNGEYQISYKTFQRIVHELAERELIKVKKVVGGSYGNTTLILAKKRKK